MVGLQAILGSSRSFLRVFVYTTGGCLQMPVRALPRLAQHESVRRMFQRYTIAFMSCMTQHCACSRAHDVLQRCAAQLLMASDRVGRPEFVLTQEFLADMLGLRRVNVGMAAQQLQRMGCIEYVRGHVTVRDRPRLESAACECYLAVKQHLDGVRD
jgi:CRP-like cAMP-binding protein